MPASITSISGRLTTTHYDEPWYKGGAVTTGGGGHLLSSPPG